MKTSFNPPSVNPFSLSHNCRRRKCQSNAMMTDKPSSELSAPGCNFIQVCNQQSSILIDPWFQCNSNPQSSPITILYPWCSLWFHPQSSLIPICDLWYSLWPDPQSSPILDPWSLIFTVTWSSIHADSDPGSLISSRDCLLPAQLWDQCESQPHQRNSSSPSRVDGRWRTFLFH